MRGNCCCVYTQVFNAKSYSSLYKLNFWLVKTIVSYFFQVLLSPKVTFTSIENIFFNESIIPTYFLSSGNSMLLFGAFSLLFGTMIEISGNQF